MPQAGVTAEQAHFQLSCTAGASGQAGVDGADLSISVEEVAFEQEDSSQKGPPGRQAWPPQNSSEAAKRGRDSTNVRCGPA